MQGHPKWICHSEEFRPNLVHWRRKWKFTLVFLLGEFHGQNEKANFLTLEYEPLRLEGVQYATGGEQRSIMNSSRKNETAEPKWKRCSVVDESGCENKV